MNYELALLIADIGLVIAFGTAVFYAGRWYEYRKVFKPKKYED